MVIDFHVHCFPDDLAGRAVPALAEEAKVVAATDGTIPALKHSMDRAGIDISVLQPVATKPSQVRAINRWQESVVDDRIAAFGALHPDLESKERLDAIKGIVDAGWKGIKLHPDYQQFFIDEERLTPFYEDVFGHGLYILFHAGIDIGLKPPYHCTPDRLAILLDRFPNALIIAAHMGSYYYWDAVEYLLEGRNLFFDTCYSIDYLGVERTLASIRRHGADKVLFATDSPWEDQLSALRIVESLDLPPSDKEKILSANARRLLGL